MPKRMCSTAWSISALMLPHGPLLAAIAATPWRPPRNLASQRLARTAWSGSQLHFVDAPLFAGASRWAKPAAAAFGAQCIANSAWSLAARPVWTDPMLCAAQSVVPRRRVLAPGAYAAGVVVVRARI